MNILVATDDNFVQHCAAMLVSLLDNNREGVTLYLLSGGISEINNKLLNDLVVLKGGNYN